MNFSAFIAAQSSLLYTQAITSLGIASIPFPLQEPRPSPAVVNPIRTESDYSGYRSAEHASDMDESDSSAADEPYESDAYIRSMRRCMTQPRKSRRETK